MYVQEAKNWIQKAIKHPGALRSTASKAHELNPDGSIKDNWLNKEAKGTGKTAERARLAKTLKKMH